jgi:hypothetical protein
MLHEDSTPVYYRGFLIFCRTYLITGCERVYNPDGSIHLTEPTVSGWAGMKWTYGKETAAGVEPLGEETTFDMAKQKVDALCLPAL